MSDKYLTVKEWQKFAAERAYKDSPASKAFVKALGAAEKAGDASPAERLKILEALETAGRDLLKLSKGDRKLEAYLEEVNRPLSRYRKEADDEEDGPAWLDPKLLDKQLRQCRADPELRLRFAYVDGGGKAPAVLVMSRKIEPRKLLEKLKMQTRLSVGTCGLAWVADTDLILQLDAPMKGKRQDILNVVKECGFKAIAKVVLWSEDGKELVDDESAPAAAAGGPEAKPADPPAATIAPEAEFVARLKALLPRVTAASATKEGQAAKLLANEAGGFARKADFAAAMLALDKVDRLLARLNAPAAAAPAQRPAAAAGPWQPLAPIWEEASERAIDQTTALVIEMRQFADDELDRMADDLLKSVEGFLSAIGELVDDYDRLDGEERLELREEFLDQLRRQKDSIAADRLIEAADVNPLGVRVSLNKTLQGALDGIVGALQP